MVARKKGKKTDSNNDQGIPASMKKFRQSPEIEGFYRFIFENDLRTEAFEIIDNISQARAAAKNKTRATKKKS
ncbi:MAG: hypothetical protein KDD33_08660 [Bdellovibrionales bacterium]|nr:hypothetical protein [Bdellovibrionales bacterium]